MEDLRKSAIESATISVQIDALRTMVDYDLKIVEDFNIKNTIIELIRNQELIVSRLNRICEEQKSLRSLLYELRQELADSGN